MLKGKGNKMTKTNNHPVPSGRDLMENIEYSPYYKVAMEMIRRKNIDNPSIADLFEAFHEIAKVDNKINKGVK